MNDSYCWVSNNQSHAMEIPVSNIGESSSNANNQLIDNNITINVLEVQTQELPRNEHNFNDVLPSENDSPIIRKSHSNKSFEFGLQSVPDTEKITAESPEKKEDKIELPKETIEENEINQIPLPPPPPFVSSIPVPPCVQGAFPPPPPPGPIMPAKVYRKKPVKPKSKMKVLHWNRILIPPNVTPAEGKIWLDVPEIKIDEMDKFVELFSVRKMSKPIPDLPSKNDGKIKILDPKRSQNVGISMRKLSVSKVRKMLYDYNTKSGLTTEELKMIDHIKATESELEILHEVTEVDRLDKPDRWLLELSEIDMLQERIICLKFKTEFDYNIRKVFENLNISNSLSVFFLENQYLKQTLGIILTLGNYLNGDNDKKGRADGFDLDSLDKLKTLKSNNAQISLLHFVVKTYIKKVSNEKLAVELPYPLPDSAILQKGSIIDFDECSRDFNSIKTNYESERIFKYSKLEFLDKTVNFFRKPNNFDKFQKYRGNNF